MKPGTTDTMSGNSQLICLHGKRLCVKCKHTDGPRYKDHKCHSHCQLPIDSSTNIWCPLSSISRVFSHFGGAGLKFIEAAGGNINKTFESVKVLRCAFVYFHRLIFLSCSLSYDQFICDKASFRKATNPILYAHVTWLQEWINTESAQVVQFIASAARLITKAPWLWFGRG